jgi:Tfp pilus assembly protein PilX
VNPPISSSPIEPRRSSGRSAELTGPSRRERGMALVIAMLALTMLSLLGLVLMTSVNTDTKLTSHSLAEATALNNAEAGIAEATTRIMNGDINLSTTNAKSTALIFNQTAGNVPPVGADTVALPTAQPAGSWLAYSTANKGPEVLTVTFKTDANRTVIYKYDPSKNPPVQTVSGMPIYVVKSTGRYERGGAANRINQATRATVTEIVQMPIILNTKGAMAANYDVKFNGNAVVCGYNHRADTPDDAGKNGRAGVGGCNENPGANHWETAWGNLAGIWSTNNVQTTGGAAASGTPAEAQNQVGFYAGPWEALSMTQAEFYAWVGTRLSAEPANINGIVYLDNNGTTQDHSGNFAFNGGTGSGFMYVDGDLTLNSDFRYRGFIYVEGNLNLNGQAWILGGLVAKGESKLKINGGATVLYSWEAIQTNIAKFKGNFITLAWREQ